MSNHIEPVEIKRKFLLRDFLPIPPRARYEIKSAYISLQPEIRIRQMDLIVDAADPCTSLPPIPDRFKMTVKGKGTLSRFESETYISEKFFNEMLEFIDKDPIHKLYFLFDDPDGKHEIEYSIVDQGKSTQFAYAEVEFDSEEEANAYQWPFPEILICEVTDDYKYKMKNYWIRTRNHQHKHSTR